MAACLRLRFLAMNRSSPPNSPSTSLNAVAMARCSARAEANEKPMTPTALGNALRERGMTSYKTGHGARAWRGIGLLR